MTELKLGTDSAIETIRAALDQSEEQIQALQQELAQKSPDTAELRREVTALQEALEESRRERDDWRYEFERLETVLADERGSLAYLRHKLSIAESAPDHVTRNELNFWRGRVDSVEQSLKEAEDRAQELQAELDAAQQEGQREQELRLEAERQRDGARERITDLEKSLSRAEDRADTSARTARETRAELDELQKQLQAAESSAREALSVQADLQARLSEAQAQDARHQAHLASLENQLDSAREEMRSTELELNTTRQRSGELAQLLETHRLSSERLDEELAAARERMAEYQHRLTRLQLVEAWAARRRVLAHRLVEAVRARHRANVTLKQAVDSLRAAKASAAEREEQLTSQLRRLRDKHEGSNPGAGNGEDAARRDQLEKQLDAQQELIASLESELRSLRGRPPERTAEKPVGEAQIAQLRETLRRKDLLIESLEADIVALRRRYSGAQNPPRRGESEDADRTMTIKPLNISTAATQEAETDDPPAGGERDSPRQASR